MRRGILIVAPYLPWPADFGGAIRIYELTGQLSRDHDVMLLAPAAASEMIAVDHLSTICDVTAVPVSWTFRQPAGWRKRLDQARSMVSSTSFVELASRRSSIQAVLDRLVMTRQIDLIQYEFPQMTLFKPSRPFPTVLDNHNVEFELLQRVAETATSIRQRRFNDAEWRKVRDLEWAAWSGVTVNVATSARDAAHIEQHTSQHVPIIPNGVDVVAWQSAATSVRTPGKVVFTGAMRHQPNADGAVWYATQVHPQVLAVVPDATLDIVGADPPESVRALASDTIRVTGRVESIQPYLSRASAAIVPLHAGGGTRLKVLEAFAAGVPVVSTSVGAEGIDVVSERDLLIADDATSFANAVISLLTGSGLPAGFDVAHASQLVAEHYDWGGAVVPALTAAHDLAIERFQNQKLTPS